MLAISERQWLSVYGLPPEKNNRGKLGIFDNTLIQTEEKNSHIVAGQCYVMDTF